MQQTLALNLSSTNTRAPRKGWTLAIASLGLFMAALDTLVVTTALPVLRVDLGASLPDLEWTVNIYNLAFACLLLTGAALGDRFGRRRMFAIGLSVFTAASAAAPPPPPPAPPPARPPRRPRGGPARRPPPAPRAGRPGPGGGGAGAFY